MSEHKDKIPPVTDDVDLEILPKEAAKPAAGNCHCCGARLPTNRLAGRCTACGALFMSSPFLA